MTKQWQIPRRTFLKGLGTSMALPLLDAMAPKALCADAAGAQGLADGSALPTRMAFVYVPNGANMADWTPQGEGSDFELPPILQPLEPWRRQVQILTGLAQRKGDPNGDGAGDHARASASFLTGAQARKTAAVDIRAGVSVDQVAAAQIGRLTRLPSLELGCDKGQQAGACDSGYSCAYQFNLSWKTENTPLPPEVDPRLVFERLFSSGTGPGPSSRRANQRASVLDFVLEDARRLESGLGRTDRQKLDEYMTAVRELEQRIERADRMETPVPDFAKPTAVPSDYREHIRILYDLMALAFQTDTTRIATFMVAHDGSNRSYPFIGVPEGHHDLSHHGGNADKKSKIARINRFHLEQFAYVLERMQSMKEGSGTLLDRCMIIYGSGLSDGNAHSHVNLPVLLAGGGNGRLQPGRHVRLQTETPMNNLYLSMLDVMGAKVARFGDSTGRLLGLG